MVLKKIHYKSLNIAKKTNKKNYIRTVKSTLLKNKLIFMKKNTQMLKKIPKIARFSRNKLALVISKCIDSQTWKNLLLPLH